MRIDCALQRTRRYTSAEWRGRTAWTQIVLLTPAQPLRRACGKSPAHSPGRPVTPAQRPMLKGEVTAVNCAAGGRAAGLLMRLPMPVRSRGAQRACVHVERESVGLGAARSTKKVARKQTTSCVEAKSGRTGISCTNIVQYSRYYRGGVVIDFFSLKDSS